MARPDRSDASAGRQPSGVTLAELMVTVSVLTTIVTISVPMLLTGIDDARPLLAARYLAARLRFNRMEAVKRSTAVGVRFSVAPGRHAFAVFVDGNGNGIRTAEIGRGIDRQLGDDEVLSALYPGVTFGVALTMPSIGERDTLAAGSDPIRLGRSNILTFTPLGTASPGTVYVRGRGARQYAVRVLGPTGRTRVLEYRPEETRWIER